MSHIFTIGHQRIFKPAPPVRDREYLRFLRSLICICCGAKRWIEAAHFGPHGIGQKASDLDALPLCHRCHRTGSQSYHKLGPRRFAEVHQLNVTRHQERLREFYFEKVRRAA